MHYRRNLFLACLLWILGVVGMFVGIIIGAIEQTGIQIGIFLSGAMVAQVGLFLLILFRSQSPRQ